MNKSLIVQLLTLCSIIFHINTVQAESTYFKQTLGANIGYFFTDINNSAKFHGSVSESGDFLSFEKDLSLNDRVNTFKTDIFWRITPKHRLDFTWFGLFQDGQTLTTEEFTIGDNIIPAGTGITSKFNHNRFQLNYTYHLFQGANYELGPSLGVYTININTEIRPTIGNEAIETYASSSLTLPLPVVGFRGSYGITDNLIVLSNFDFMIAKIGDWEGEIYSYQLAFEYNFIKYVGIGVAYNFSLFNVENNREHYKFRYDYKYHGMQTYLKFAF